MENSYIHKILRILKKECKRLKVPVVTEVSKSRSPYKVLISCLISLRTKDAVTEKASDALFKLADTPRKMIKLTPKKIEKVIYPAAFFRRKSLGILKISKLILSDYKGKVPGEIDELLKLPGVGRKTANLTVTLGYGKEGICVDTHVHRISNRIGYVQTGTPDKTEFVLREKLPKKYWIAYNDLLVAWGQNICVPVSPFCSKCAIKPYCERNGVERSR